MFLLPSFLSQGCGSLDCNFAKTSSALLIYDVQFALNLPSQEVLQDSTQVFVESVPFLLIICLWPIDFAAPFLLCRLVYWLCVWREADVPITLGDWLHFLACLLCWQPPQYCLVLLCCGSLPGFGPLSSDLPEQCQSFGQAFFHTSSVLDGCPVLLKSLSATHMYTSRGISYCHYSIHCHSVCPARPIFHPTSQRAFGLLSLTLLHSHNNNNNTFKDTQCCL